MRTGIWFPVSNNMLAIAFIVTIVIVVIYILYHLAKNSADKAKVSQLESQFLGSNHSEFELFGFPARASTIFSVRKIDGARGVGILRTVGRVGTALCFHSQLSYVRFYFFIDFDFFDRPSAVVTIKSTDGKTTRLKINSESSMFSQENFRFFEIPPSEREAFFNDHMILEVDGRDFELTKEEIEEIQRAVDYVVMLPQDEQTKLNKWRNLQ